jgi:siroheme synthase (precorrin-2 oxidase/ferrochelatase)
VRATRVLLVGLPRMTSEKIKALLDDSPELTIVGESSQSDLSEAVSRTKANVIVVPSDDTQMPAAAHDLLDKRALRVVAITRRGNSGVVVELTQRRSHIDVLTRESLIRALEGAEV